MPTSTRSVRWTWILLGLYLVVVACSSLVPRQGWNPANGPVVPHDSFPEDCTLCHASGDWHTLRADFQFDHEKKTGVALRGAHAQAPCLMCHNDRGPIQQFAALGCRGCHTDPHQGRLGMQCSTCHEEKDWHPSAQIAAHDKTRFPLIGAHAAVACFRCHAGAQVGNFSGATSQCEACHTADINRATSPDHRANGWTSNCQRCHSPLSFVPAQFEHPSSFPLILGHANRRCDQCHLNGVFTGLSTTCVNCHQTDFANTTNPMHTGSGFPTTCETCHTIARWQPASFPHTSTFPLTNGHALACNRCHTTPGVYTGQSTTCSSCHMGNYSNPANVPNHVAGGYPTTCETCHVTTAWRTGGFAHPASFPLTTGHANVACARCHTTPGVYTGLSTTCNTCHLTNYNATTNPNHVTGGYPTTCEMCHTTTTWRNGNFAHPAAFPLTGGHAGRQCAVCHTTPGTYAPQRGATCYTCHQTNYTATTNPNHITANFPTTCQQCHSTIAWRPANFSHPATMPLTNAHNLACNRCHTTPGVYTGLQATCVSCHLTNYNNTTNPVHTGSGFPTTCQTCHGTTAWRPATFSHPASFPLTNGHANRACAACHTTPGVYTGRSTACVSCHLATWQATTNPPHANIGMAQTCQDCHPTTTWRTSTFVHSPTINSAHRGLSCVQCHLGNTAPAGLQCTACHEHNQTSMANEHRNRSGYSWVSSACYNCHPQLRG